MPETDGHKSVRQILGMIEENTDYLFVYNQEEVDLNRVTSVDVNYKSVKEILSSVFSDTDVSYVIKGDNIVLMKKGSQQQDPIIISGTVLYESGEPVAGATIREKGVTNGTTSDVNGQFRLNVQANAVLQISYLGFASREIPIGSQTAFEIVLVEDSYMLDEAIVIGYGVQKKSNLTGSVETITAKSLENRPVSSVANMLQGHVAGMTFSTPSQGMTPGANSIIEIRGRALLSANNAPTTPLVVIDGIPADMSDLNNLNPNDLENISVLKDAAASAIYGARAPYGVLLVTTKRGRLNEKASITYSGNLGWVTPVRYPQTADTYTFALGINDARLNSRQAILFTQERIDLVKDNIENPGKYSPEELFLTITPNAWGSAAYNTNWFDVWFRSSLRQQHNLSVKGGTQNTGYYVSAGYTFQPGILNFVKDIDNFSRFNINGNLDARINDWITFSYINRYSLSQYKEPAMEYGDGRSRIFTYVYGAHPNNPVKQPDGSYSEASRIPMATQGGSKVLKEHRLDNIASLDINPVKGWNVHIDGTWRMYFNDYQMHRMPAYTGMPNGEQRQISGTESLLNKYMDMNNYWTVQGYTSYEGQLAKHYFKVMVGSQAEERTDKRLTGEAKELVVPEIDAMRIALGNRTVNDLLSDWATAGFFGRINYNFDELYLFELNARYDGSGRYQRSKRWGFFPSVSAGWNISNESFWQSIASTVNFAKLRASYGTLGNQGNSSGYLHIPTMQANTTQSQWIFGSERKTYLNPPGLLNMIRTWEKFTTLDVGVEFRLFNSRLSAEADWFNRKSWDLIGPSTPMPSVLGEVAPDSNNAEMITKGWEAQVSWRDNLNARWNYSARVSVSDAWSEITKYNTTTRTIGDNAWYEGKKMNEIWGYQVNRLLNETDFDETGKLFIPQSRFNAYWYPGDVKYENLDGDESITPGDNTVDNPGDMRILGNSTPRYRFSAALSTGYSFNKAGHIELSAVFEGVMKRDLWMGASPFYYFGRSGGTISEVSMYEGHMDFYRDENSYPEMVDYLGLNKDAFFPLPYATTEGAKNFQKSSRYIVSGAYMRMKTLQLSYSLSPQWLKAARIASCQLYFSGENLFVMSYLPKYFDPEFVNEGRMYPQQRTLSVGINIGF